MKVINFAHFFTNITGYWEVYRHFQGIFCGLGVRREGLTWEYLSMEEVFMGEGTFQ